MKHVELNKLNRHIYASTFGLQTIKPMEQKMSRKRMHFNYKQYRHIIHENGDMLLQIMMVGDQRPTVTEIMAIPLGKYINLSANDCQYSGTVEELIVNYVYQ